MKDQGKKSIGVERVTEKSANFFFLRKKDKETRRDRGKVREEVECEGREEEQCTWKDREGLMYLLVSRQAR